VRCSRASERPLHVTSNIKIPRKEGMDEGREGTTPSYNCGTHYPSTPPRPVPKTARSHALPLVSSNLLNWTERKVWCGHLTQGPKRPTDLPLLPPPPPKPSDARANASYRLTLPSPRPIPPSSFDGCLSHCVSIDVSPPPHPLLFEVRSPSAASGTASALSV
jgi:hypothetical protein